MVTFYLSPTFTAHKTGISFFGQIRKGALRIWPKNGNPVLCAQNVRWVCLLTAPCALFLLLTRLRVLPAASSISEIDEAEEAAGSTLVWAQISWMRIVCWHGTIPPHFGPIKRGCHFFAKFGKICKGLALRIWPKNGNPVLRAQNVRWVCLLTAPCALFCFSPV